MGALVTNITRGPRGAWLDGEEVWAAPGETIEADDYSAEWFRSADEPVIDPNGGADAMTLNESILVAIAGLDADNDENWTADHKPTVEAVVEALGFNVTRKQIDTAAPDAKRPDPTPV